MPNCPASVPQNSATPHFLLDSELYFPFDYVMFNYWLLAHSPNRTSPVHTGSVANANPLPREAATMAQQRALGIAQGSVTYTPALLPFDIVIDTTAPTSPVGDSPPLASSSSSVMTPPRPTRPRDLRQSSALLTLAHPLTSDDDWPSPDPSPQLRKAPTTRRVKTHHPLVITMFEFTLAPFSGPDEEDNEDDVSWYARELNHVVSLASPSVPSSSNATSAHPDSLLSPPSRGSRTCPRGWMSKPLPALPGPSPQLDPTFPCRRTTSRRLTCQPFPTSPLPPRITTTPSVCKSLKITVLRAPPRTPLPLDVADIFNDIDAWSVFAPSAGPCSTSTATSLSAALSPPRLPQTPESRTANVAFSVCEAALPSWLCCPPGARS